MKTFYRVTLAKQQLCTRITLFCTFLLAVVARLQRKSALFHVLSRTGTQDNNFRFLSLNFDTVLDISTPKEFASIRRIKRDGISAIKFEVARIHFLSDVFVAVAVFVA